MKWINRMIRKPYKELWFMVFGFDEYKSGLLYRYERAQARLEALDTTVDVLRKRVNKLEKDLKERDRVY